MPLLLFLAVPAGLLMIDEFTTPRIRLGPLMVAAPALAAAFCSPSAVLLVTVVTAGCVVGAADVNEQLSTPNFVVQLTAVLLIGTAAAVASILRQRRERELARVRQVAEAAQGLLLRPLPRRLGSLEISSVYLAAEEEATIGGDFYAAAEVGGTVRVLVGDVQGKGLGAVEVVGYVLGAFRSAARQRTSLAELVPAVERSLREDLEEAAEADLHDPSGGHGARQWLQESFTTAVVVDALEDSGRIRVANCGHLPPLLIREGEVRSLDPVVPSLPLGLGDMDGGGPPIDTFDFCPGDTLLLYTDGVIEARDRYGCFYPLADRLREWGRYSPDDLLTAIRADLLRHVRERLRDDVAMVAIHRKTA